MASRTASWCALTTITEAELFDYVRCRLALHTTPKVWRFVDRFQLTPSGSVQKFVLSGPITGPIKYTMTAKSAIEHH